MKKLPYVALVEPLYWENVGFVARLVKNFNSRGLILVNPKADLEKAKKTAVNAGEVLENAIVLESFEELRKGFPYIIGTTGKTGSSYNLTRSVIYPWQIKVAKPTSTAIVFGREDIGLKNEELEKCDVVVTIPTSEEYRVLNLSHAVGIILYELFSRKYRGKMAPFEPADRAVKEAIFKKIDFITKRLGYPPGKDKIISLIWKRVLGKSLLTKREAYGIAGFFSKIIKKLK